jgi:hypothetical protein
MGSAPNRRPTDWGWLQAEVASALEAFIGQFDGLTGDERVPNLEWTVAELGAHLASLPGVYAEQHDLGAAFEPPHDWAQFSNDSRASIQPMISGSWPSNKARRVAGTYHLGFRGDGGDWTYTVSSDGVLTVSEGRPDRADARMNADPAAFLLVSLGRMNPYIAALKGLSIAYGRKPWKLKALGEVTVDGV